MKDGADNVQVEDEKDLGHRLQAARKLAGLTQQALCSRANLSYSTLAKIERGAIKTPSIFTIQSIALALGTGLDALMGLAPVPLQLKHKSGVEFIYFDVNGCLVHFYHRAFVLMAEDTGATPESLEAVYWRYNEEVCRGSVSMASFNQALADVAAVKKLNFLDYYVRSIEAVPDMAELVRWAAQSYRVGLLTNIMPGLVELLSEREIIPSVAYEIVIDSSVVHSIKPELAIFQVAAERTGLKPEQILLIDDTRQNVMTAEKLGWQVLQYDDYEPQDSISRIRALLET